MKIIQTHSRGIAAAALIGGLTIAGQQAAEARGTGAIAGRAGLGHKTSCFNESNGGITNVCSTRESWVMPAIYDNAGVLWLQVRARGVQGTATAVRCTTWSVDPEAGNVRSSAASTREHTGATETLAMALQAHGYGATYVICSMDPGTVIRNLHY